MPVRSRPQSHGNSGDGVEFEGNEGRLIMKKMEKKRSSPLAWISMCWAASGNPLFRRHHRNPKGEMYKCMATARWTQEDKLVIRCYVIDDYFGNMTATLGFEVMN